MPEYEVFSQRLSSRVSVATAKCAQVTLDTESTGREDIFNPAELLLAALSGSLLEGVARATPVLDLSLRGVAVRVFACCQDAPPKMSRVEYTVWLDCDESNLRLEQVHENLKKFSIVFNTVAAGCELVGTVRRGVPE